MLVRYWKTDPRTFSSAAELAAAVKKNGTEAPKTLPFGFNVPGVFFLAGGRGGIQKILDQTPDTSFQGHDLCARYLRVNGLKTLTIVVIGAGTNAEVLSKADYLLTNLVGSPSAGRNFIAYREIMPALWAAEAAISASIIKKTGFAEEESLVNPVPVGMPISSSRGFGGALGYGR